MEEKLKIILKEYIREVENVCDILVRSINNSERVYLKNKYDFFVYRANCKKMEFEAEGIIYKLHGKGCEAFNKEIFISWNFGYRSRWCGIDPWKVSRTLKKNGSDYTEYYDGNEIKKLCDLMVENGTMFKRFDQYYFEIPVEETFKTEFPIEYDMLVIEYFDSKWCIPRSKIIDKFIRKSGRVYNQIYRMKDKYILRFLLNGNEVYAVPYSDIGYPENAVKIMSDIILQSLK